MENLCRTNYIWRKSMRWTELRDLFQRKGFSGPPSGASLCDRSSDGGLVPHKSHLAQVCATGQAMGDLCRSNHIWQVGAIALAAGDLCRTNEKS